MILHFFLLSSLYCAIECSTFGGDTFTCGDDCNKDSTVLITDCQSVMAAASVRWEAVCLVYGRGHVWLEVPLAGDLTDYCNGESDAETVITTLTVIMDLLQQTHGRMILVTLLSTAPEISSRVDSLITDIVQLSDMERHVFYFFLHDTVSEIGTVQQYTTDVMYADSSHIHLALMLDKLIKNKLADSLQAHLLANGVLVTVNDVKSFHNYPFPSLNDVLGPPYTNMCIAVVCNGYCSPLHGCVELSNSRPLQSTLDRTTNATVLLQGYTTLDHTATTLRDGDNGNEALSIMQPSTDGYSVTDVIHDTLEPIDWKMDTPFINYLINQGQPTFLRNTVVNSWGAITEQWDMQYICDTMDTPTINNDTPTINNVKCSNSYLTFDPDHNAPLKLNLSIPYTVKNMSKSSFCSCVQNTKNCEYKGYYHFNSLPDSLKYGLKPNNYLFNTEKDMSSAKQFIWISSKGMITHAHFDQDYNVFVQLVGQKRFTLWLPWQHELMYMYPRVHPLWHKSRVNINDPDVSRFPLFRHSRAIQVTLGPGDLLFIPPYTWHYVETLSPSVSLSTWSHDYHMYSHMNTIYGHDHKFDLIHNSTGQMFALRIYLDLLIQDIHGYRHTSRYFSRLLATRFTGLEHHFPPSPNDELMCPHSIPTCQHVYGYAKLDVAIISEHFKALRPIEAMDVLLMNYVEEISAQVVGVERLLAFFRYCFQGQDYHMTDINTSEHLMWD